MSTKNAPYSSYSKYTMDQREFPLIEALIEKDIVILPKKGLNFYFSYEYIDAAAHTIMSTSIERFDNKVDYLKSRIKKMAQTMGGQDFRLYGLFNGKECYFYDLKINDNYFCWEDLQIELEVFEIPIIDILWKGTVNSVQEIQDIITKKFGKEEKDFLFRPIIEDIEISYSGGARKVNTEKKEITTDEVDTILEEFSGKGNATNGPFAGRFSNLTEDISDLEELEPYLVYTIVGEDGELDEEAIKAFFDFYSKKESIQPALRNLEEEGIDINVPNRSLVVEQIIDYITIKIVNDAFETCIKYIKEDKPTFTEKIRREITPNCTELVNKMINQQRQDEVCSSYVDVDEELVNLDFKETATNRVQIMKFAQHCFYKNMWQIPEIARYCEQEIAEIIADDLYCLNNNSLMGKETITTIIKIISPKILPLARQVSLERNLLEGFSNKV